MYFNPPTPCGVGLEQTKTLMPTVIFQSTHLVWGGTLSDAGGNPAPFAISIHPPRVGWDLSVFSILIFWFAISIHPPRVGWDTSSIRAFFAIPTFQSTHPVWGGTPVLRRVGFARRISIHPPRVGWDRSHTDKVIDPGISIHPPRVGWDDDGLHLLPRHSDFNPPTPCGVGHEALHHAYAQVTFQSTHPVWGGTTI